MAVTNQMLFGAMQRALCHVTELTTLVEKLMQDSSSVGDSGITIVSDMHGHSFAVTQRGDVAATW